ncbi:MAG: VanZ family protein [Cyanobacteria bacterium P01_F01_bin.33]
MHAPTSKYVILLRIGFFGTAALVAGLALFPYLTLPEPAITRGFTDKIYHFVGCAVLVILAVEGWSQARRLAILALPLAFSLEWIQALVPGRGIHIADSIANVAGVSIALILLLGLGRLTPTSRDHDPAT